MSQKNKKSNAVLPVILSVGMCATTVGLATAVSTPAYAQSTTVTTSSSATRSNQAPDAQLPPVRTSLTKEEAEQMEGCVAFFDQV